MEGKAVFSFFFRGSILHGFCLFQEKEVEAKVLEDGNS